MYCPPPNVSAPSMMYRMSAVQAIYTHHVCHSLATFETEAPNLEEMLSRRLSVLQQNLPYLVAEDWEHDVEGSVHIAGNL